MARLAEIRAELGAILTAAVPNLNVHHNVPDAVSVPAVVVATATPFATYQRRMGGETTALFRFEVTFVTGRVAEVASQELLNEWASPDGPILTALYDADLDEAEVLTVVGQQFGSPRFGTAEYLGFSLLVEIEA